MSSIAAPPIVSVVIITHNRAEHLERSIASVLAQDSAGVPYELIVIDNASRDLTREVVDAKTRDFPNLKYVLEPRLGESHARNTGFQTAQCSLVAYLDDDAIANPGWLKQIPIAFAEAGADVACVTGRVDPIWGAPRPPWLHDDLLPLISAVDWSPAPGRLTDRQWPIGANVAFRREALYRVGGFSTKLGRRGPSLLSNAEILLYLQLTAHGYSSYYDPKLAVRHFVAPERLDKRWFRRRAYWQGVSDVILDANFDAKSRPALAWKRFRRFGSLIKHPMHVLALVDPSDDPVRFRNSCSAIEKFGYATAGFPFVPK